MADLARNGRSPALTSEWGGLNPNLIATFFAVKKQPSEDKTSIVWMRDDTQPEVRAPLTEGGAEATQNWQSPFENVGPDQKFSSFSALLQAGGFSSLMAQLKAMFPNSETVDAAKSKAESLEGRSNLTKLNSTQVFTGMQPLKISVTAHFRAYRDPISEVREPMDQLMRWGLPQEIAADGPVVQAVGGNITPFPSRVPQIIGMKYADMLFAPIVIESHPFPITGPRDAAGRLTHAAMTLQLASLTALDRRDWDAMRTSMTAFGFK